MNSRGVEIKAQGEASVQNSFDEKSEVVENGLEMHEEGSTLGEHITEPPLDMGENSAQEKTPVHVFVYGVRYFVLAKV